MDKDDEEFDVIYTYTREQAIEDGVLIPVGSVVNQSVVFTTNLFYDGYENDEQKIKDLVNRGLELLRKPDPEDTEYMQLRVIEKDKIWVVWNAEGFTFMKPQDY